ncbi:hypothetical protein BDV28DRAFT_122211 [Aspergillus coremiiformis]|uniref:C2H2-type domain-containing protein n=1 Tax=Aspergillus coremiiformis TaxID=138285 RepID=A0A5N6Z6C7_9EURO|nr:hypothetical protein BDV28DRAFT_122211 [Aspergillus coremiiformis]
MSFEQTRSELAASYVDPIWLTPPGPSIHSPGTHDTGTTSFIQGNPAAFWTAPVLDAQMCAPCPRLTGNGRARDQKVGRQDRVSKHNANPRSSRPFRCGWKLCRYTGVFGRKEELMRHIETIHVSPGSYHCPAESCQRVFNRNDKVQEHVRRVHRDDDSSFGA